MGCFSCFDSKEEEKLNTQKPSDDRKQALPMVSSNISRMPSGLFLTFLLIFYFIFIIYLCFCHVVS